MSNRKMTTCLQGEQIGGELVKVVTFLFLLRLRDNLHELWNIIVLVPQEVICLSEVSFVSSEILVY